MGRTGVRTASSILVLTMITCTLFIASDIEGTGVEKGGDNGSNIDMSTTPNILEKDLPIEGNINSHELGMSGDIFFTSLNDGIYSIGTDGKINWHIPSYSQDLRIISLISEEDPLIEHGGKLERYRGSTGEVIWTYDIQDGTWDIEHKDEIIYIEYTDDIIEALSYDGEVIWKWPEKMVKYEYRTHNSLEYRERSVDGEIEHWSFEVRDDGGFHVIQESHDHEKGESRYVFSVVSKEGHTLFNYTIDSYLTHMDWGDDHLMRYSIDDVSYIELLNSKGETVWNREVPFEDHDSFSIFDDEHLHLWEENYVEEGEKLLEFSKTLYSMDKEGDLEKIFGPVENALETSLLDDTGIYLIMTVDELDLNDWGALYTLDWDLVFIDINGKILWETGYNYMNDTLDIEYDGEGGVIITSEEKYAWIRSDGEVTKGSLEDLDPRIFEEDVLTEEYRDARGNYYSFKGNVSKFSPEGDLIWSYRPSGGTGSTPLMDEEGNIYVTTYHDRIVKVNTSGEIEWEMKFNTSLILEGAVLTESNGTQIMIQTSNGYSVFGVSLDGSILWDLKMEHHPRSEPVAYDNNRTLITGYQHLSMIDNRGQVLWTAELESYGTQRPLVGADGNIFVSTGQHLSSYSTRGELLWSHEDKERSWTNPVMGDNGNIIVGSRGLFFFDTEGNILGNSSETFHHYWNLDELFMNHRGEIFGLEGNDLMKFNENGEVLWTFRIYWNSGRPVFDEQGNIFIVNQGLIALSGDGEVLWHYKTNLMRGQNHDIRYRALITDDGMIFHEGSLYHLRWTDDPTKIALDAPDSVYFGSMGSLYVDYLPRSNGIPVSGYRIYRGESTDELQFWKEIDPYSGREVIFDDDEWERIEYFQIESFDDRGNSARTEIISNSMIWNDTLPSPPIVIRGSYDDGKMTIQWEPSRFDGGHHITGYLVLRGIDDEEYEVIDRVGPDTHAYVDEDPPEGHKIRWRIAAENELGWTLSENGWKMITSEKGTDNSLMLIAGAGTALLVIAVLISIYLFYRKADLEYEMNEEGT